MFLALRETKKQTPGRPGPKQATLVAHSPLQSEWVISKSDFAVCTQHQQLCKYCSSTSDAAVNVHRRPDRWPGRQYSSSETDSTHFPLRLLL